MGWKTKEKLFFDIFMHSEESPIFTILQWFEKMYLPLSVVSKLSHKVHLFR